ncbi:MAG: bifunctional oligoribonuclease/PAP phosphatase NrnA [Ruminococcaceae bacterium]|nr:bifunctional oligoribonuclease/PAP phosphatase NrnA [Oscillospiraceae bacterium]
MFEQIIEKIKEYKRIIIHRHKNPDGDALGSQIGLKNMIADAYPEKEVYMVGDMTPRFSFMEGAVMDEIPDEYYPDALAIVLDTSAATLISDERYKSAKESVRMDHHIFVEKICDTELTDTSYESCCGLVTELAIEGGFTLSPVAAKALYTGMVTDSGRFRYDSTNSNTHRLASHLMKTTFDTNDIYSNLYADELSFIQLRAKFVLKINLTPYRVAYIYTPLDEAKSYGVDYFTISRGMVNTMGDIRGVDIWVNFTETEDGVLTEIRSNKFNINPVATKYGGGGHAKASGATVKDKNEAMLLLADLNAFNI